MDLAGQMCNHAAARNRKFEDMERDLREVPTEEALSGRIWPLSLMGNISWQHCHPDIAQASNDAEADEALARSMQFETHEEALQFGSEGAVGRQELGNDSDCDVELAVALAESANQVAASPSNTDDAEMAWQIHIQADEAAAWQSMVDDEIIARSEMWENDAHDREMAQRLQIEADAEAALRSAEADGQLRQRRWGASSSSSQRQNARGVGEGGRGTRNLHSLASNPQRALNVLQEMRRTHGLRGNRSRNVTASDSDEEWQDPDAFETEFAVPGANADQVASSTTTMRFSANGDASATIDECNICRESYVGGEALRVLPCMHRFHTACIDRWLAQSRTCPICKHDIAD